jgi:CSLREA domain-containing protein
LVAKPGFSKRSFSRARRATLIGTAAAGMTAIAPQVAQADNFVVKSLTDRAVATCDAGCTLRDALAAASASAGDDTITFDSSLSGVYKLTQNSLQVTNADATEILGPAAHDITISGDADAVPGRSAGDVRILQVSGAGALSLSDLNLAGGYAQGGNSSGGAIYATASSTIAIDDSTISGNTATGNGGAIWTGKYDDATITDSQITGNKASQGGAIYSEGSLTVTDSVLSGNTATGRGGAIRSYGKYAPLTVTSSNFADNSAVSGGAISHLAKYQTVAPALPPYFPADSVIRDTTVVHNQSGNNGAGLEVDDLNPNDTFTVTHSTLTDNTATGSGGGFVFDGQIAGAAEIVDSTVSGNHAAKGGGGAFGIGGPSGPLITGGSLAVNNSTVAGNEATTAGGGLYLNRYYVVPADTHATVPLNSTIVADNKVAGDPDDLGAADPPPTGGGFALAFSLIETPGTATLLSPGTSIIGTDPQLGALGNNGGPTKTMLPAESSPVVDKGKAAAGLMTDQRGDPRTAQRNVPNAADGTDIGAVELPAGGPAPDTKITKGPKKKVKTKKRKTKVTIAFTSDQSEATFQCKVDNGSFKTCTSPFTKKLKAKSGKGKKHTIQVRAIGAGGVVDPTPAEVTVRVKKKG